MGMVLTYGGTPRAGYFIGEHAIKIDDLGLPYFRKAPYLLILEIGFLNTEQYQEWWISLSNWAIGPHQKDFIINLTNEHACSDVSQNGLPLFIIHL